MEVLIGYMIDGRNSGIDKYLLRVLRVFYDAGIHADILTGKDNVDLRTCLAPFKAEIHEIPGLMHPQKQYKAMRKILSQKAYDAAYFNISEPMNCIGAKAAHDAGVSRVILHSHSTSQGESSIVKAFLKSFMNGRSRNKLPKYVNAYYACSKAAAKWLFPSELVEQNKVKILYNPIEVERYAFDSAVRAKMRSVLGFSEKDVVLGHIGNYVTAKNSTYLLKILQKTREKLPNAKLLLIGDGPDRLAVEAQAKEMQLFEHIQFLGIRDDVPSLLQAMDAFLLPSLFEGLPVSAIEAQVAGLKTFLSDRITDEVKLTDDCVFLDIENNGGTWANAIVNAQPCVHKNVHSFREQIRPFDLDAQKEEILSILG